MKKILIITLILLSNNMFAQNTVYFILTSTPQKPQPEGIQISQIAKEDVHNYGSIFFNLRSKNRDINLSFIHANYNLTELAKIRQPRSDDQMTISTVTETFVNSVNPIDLDVLFATWTKQQVDEFYQSMRRKTIYIIDRSSMTFVGGNPNNSGGSQQILDEVNDFIDGIIDDTLPNPSPGHYEYKMYQVRHALHHSF